MNSSCGGVVARVRRRIARGAAPGPGGRQDGSAAVGVPARQAPPRRLSRRLVRTRAVARTRVRLPHGRPRAQVPATPLAKAGGKIARDRRKVHILRMIRRGRPGGGPVRLFCARRPRPGRPCRSSSSAAPHVRAAAVPGGPGRTDVDAVIDDDRDDRPRRSGRPRSCRPRRPPASPPPPGKSFRPTDPVPPPARPPHPRGSRFGDVTWARIAPGGLARIERGRIPSRWARTARGGVDRVALSSHYASRTRLRAPPVRPT